MGKLKSVLLIIVLFLISCYSSGFANSETKIKSFRNRYNKTFIIRYFDLDQLNQVLKIKNIPVPFQDEELTANAGEDINACKGTIITLDGNGSKDPEGQTFTFRWFFYEKPIGSQAFLRSSDTSNPYFIPDKTGEYYITLVITSIDGRTDSDTVCISVQDCSVYPVAVIDYEEYHCKIPVKVELDGSNSFVKGDDEIIFYNWILLDKPESSESRLLSENLDNNSIVIDIEGIYKISLTVESSLGYTSEPAIAFIQASPGIPPKVNSSINRYNINSYSMSKVALYGQFTLFNRDECFLKPVQFEVHRSINGGEYQLYKTLRENDFTNTDNTSYYYFIDKYYELTDDLSYVLLGYDINNNIIIENELISKGKFQ